MSSGEDARLIEVESRIAFQEATLRDLNDMIARQQKQIDRLEQTCRLLIERATRAEQGGTRGPAEDEVPPHY